MGGSSIDQQGPRTVVLVGRTGNGKSATGNTILGRKAFKSGARASGVTMTTVLENTMLQNGLSLNVIDTPGLFDMSAVDEFIGKEIISCFGLAREGIDAVLLVLSARTRFSREEEATLRAMYTVFGPSISEYVIVVFTGVDELERNGENLQDYLSHQCPPGLQGLLTACKNRVVGFDNATEDEVKKEKQLQCLLSLIEMVMQDNEGQPFTGTKWFSELKEVALLGFTNEDGSVWKAFTDMQKIHAEQMKQVTDKVVLLLQEKIESLKVELEEETKARSRLEDNWKASEEAMAELRKKMDDEHQKGSDKGGCVIL